MPAVFKRFIPKGMFSRLSAIAWMDFCFIQGKLMRYGSKMNRIGVMIRELSSKRAVPVSRKNDKFSNFVPILRIFEEYNSYYQVEKKCDIVIVFTNSHFF